MPDYRKYFFKASPTHPGPNPDPWGPAGSTLLHLALGFESVVRTPPIKQLVIHLRGFESPEREDLFVWAPTKTWNIPLRPKSHKNRIQKIFFGVSQFFGHSIFSPKQIYPFQHLSISPTITSSHRCKSKPRRVVLIINKNYMFAWFATVAVAQSVESPWKGPL